MKHALQLIAALALLLVNGCATFTIKPGSDPNVVVAEYTSELSLKVFDSFLKWERENDAVLRQVDPTIHKTANDIRDNGKRWIAELRTATKAYKANKSADNLQTLLIAQQFLDLAIAEVRIWAAKGATP